MKSKTDLTYKILHAVSQGVGASEIPHENYTDEEFFECIEQLAESGYIEATRARRLGAANRWQIDWITSKGTDYLRRLHSSGF